jgi:hypothetical protein
MCRVSGGGHRQAVARFASQIEGTPFPAATKTLFSYTVDSCVSTTRTNLLDIFLRLIYVEVDEQVQAQPDAKQNQQDR